MASWRQDRGRIVTKPPETHVEAPAKRGDRLVPPARYRYPGDVIRLIIAGLVLAGALGASAVTHAAYAGAGAVAVPAVAPYTAPGRMLTGLVQVLFAAAAAATVAVTLRHRRFRLLASLAAGAVVASGALIGIIHLAGGPRPRALPTGAGQWPWLTGASLMGPALLAAAVAGTVTAAPWLSRPWRRTAWTALSLAAVVRLVTGTASPVEVVVALAAGVTIGASVLVLFGVPDRRIGTDGIAAALASAGLPVAYVEPAAVEAKGSRSFIAATGDGDPLFIKVLGSDQRDAGSALLVMERVNGSSLDRVPAPGLSDLARAGAAGVRMKSRTICRAACAALAVVLAGCTASGGHASSAAGTPPGRPGPVIAVGSFDFPESVLLAEIYGEALAAGKFPVRILADLGPREVVDPALVDGLVQLVPEYAGSALEFFSLGRLSATSDAAAANRALAASVAVRGLTAARPAPAQNANAIVVTAATAARYRLRSIADLTRVAPGLVFGGPPECPGRAYCLAGLRRVYGLRFRSFIPLDAGGPLTLQALEAGYIDVALLFTTDPSIPARHLVVLADDRGLQPAESITPLVRRDVIARYGPDLAAVLNRVSALLDTSTLRALDARVALAGQNPRLVAGSWLRARGLIPAGGGVR
jgi:osmoprotectant transport system substrate-binding protein